MGRVVKEQGNTMRLIDGIPVWGTTIDEGALQQIKRCRESEHTVGVAMMADHHLGYAVPIGGVVAYDGAISPSGVGYDIGCGNKAVLTDAMASEIRPQIKSIMDDVFQQISFGVGLNNQETVDHELFDDEAWKHPAFAQIKQKARNQLGTVGSGNHYVDIFEDEKGRVWVGNHFGSRGLGHTIATHFLKLCGAVDAIHADPLVIPVDSPMGQDYLMGMHLAGRYAYAGRDWVAQKVVNILGANVLEEVHNHHNFAWLEEHDGRKLWVVRKGATPAFPGQRGFVGGSMGEMSVILEGAEGSQPNDEQVLSYYSTVHGAGRSMGRMEAKGVIKKGVVKREGKVSQAMMDEWVTMAGVELRGAGVDESPHCYKRIDEVLHQHAGTVNLLHILNPIGVAMAGKEVNDPYKD